MEDVERICHSVGLLKHLSSPVDAFRYHEDHDQDAFDDVLYDAWPLQADRDVAEQLYDDLSTRSACLVLTAAAHHLAFAQARCEAARLGDGVASLYLTHVFDRTTCLWLLGKMPPPLSLDAITLYDAAPPRDAAPSDQRRTWHGWDSEAMAVSLAVAEHYSVWRKHLRRYVRRALREWGWTSRDTRRWVRQFRNHVPLPPNFDGDGSRTPVVRPTPAPAVRRPPGGRHWRTVLSVLASARSAMSGPQIAAATATWGGGGHEISHGTVKNTVRSLLAQHLVDGEGNDPKGPYLINRFGRQWLATDAAAKGEEPADEPGPGNVGHA